MAPTATLKRIDDLERELTQLKARRSTAVSASYQALRELRGMLQGRRRRGSPLQYQRRIRREADARIGARYN